ncbi:MAG TPA: hypothetical protein VEF04_21220 [Blastocatellia bacterium]|nr:hypothetical protein [Blastocatellia bacterium]
MGLVDGWLSQEGKRRRRVGCFYEVLDYKKGSFVNEEQRSEFRRLVSALINSAIGGEPYARQLAYEDHLRNWMTSLLQEKDTEIETLKARLRDNIAIGPNRQPEPMSAIFEPLENPTPLDEIAIWWLNGHSDNETIIDEGHIEHLPEYIAGEVYSLHGRPTRGRLWVPSEIQLNEIKWDDSKPRAKECANRGGIVIWRTDLRYLKGLPGFVTDTQMNEIEVS